MALQDVNVPLYDSSGDDKEHRLIVNEFAGRIQLRIIKGNTELEVECYKDDLDRAWQAVKRY